MVNVFAPTYSGWCQCYECGWWGYFGKAVPDAYRLELCDIDIGEYEILCSWCLADFEWQEEHRAHFIECCRLKGFGPDDWFRCTMCGRWGYFGEVVPDKYFLKFSTESKHLFELLCKRCVPIF